MQKKGLVEIADEGTLFLDEISPLNLHLQAKFLRFVETHTLKRVGGLKDIEVDLRIIAATNQDLEAACRQGKFRKDLFYRLNVCPVYIPPLHERRGDIIPLANHFISHYNKKFRKSITALRKDSEKLFLDYRWPGNVRELKNAIERAMIFEENSFITTRYLPIHLNGDSHRPTDSLSEGTALESLSLPYIEQTVLVKALKKTRGNKAQAARLLDISRDTLRYRLKKYGIKNTDIAPAG